MLPVSLVVLHLKESLGDFAPSEDIGNDYVLLVIKKWRRSIVGIQRLMPEVGQNILQYRSSFIAKKRLLKEMLRSSEFLE